MVTRLHVADANVDAGHRTGRSPAESAELRGRRRSPAGSSAGRGDLNMLVARERVLQALGMLVPQAV